MAAVAKNRCDMNREHFERLLDRYILETATPQETRELFALLEQNDFQELLRAHIIHHLDHWQGAENSNDYTDRNDSALAIRLKSRLLTRINEEENHTDNRPAHRIHFLKTAWFRYAAAILLIITGVAIYYNSLNSSASHNNKVVHTVPPAAPNDILPGTNRAVLTLSNGQKVELDSATSETITDGTLSIKNIDGQLVYASGDAPGTALPGATGEGPTAGSATALNTMTTPKGGQYQLTLADGTKVWLNAASSITYPTAFKDKTREVSITGEAYFEVAKNATQPFIVKTREDDIRVLGTQFNVNAYENENATKTSLIEGSIKINGKTLKPGQAFTNGTIVRTNIDQDIAWKNGSFDFNGLSLEVVMRQLSRWYDVDVSYEKNVPDIRLWGSMGRDLTLSQVLEVMKATGVRYRIEGRRLVILP
jgi:hypothetical protein